MCVCVCVRARARGCVRVCAFVCLVAQLWPTICDPMDCNLLGTSVHGDFPGKNTGVDWHALLQGNLPNPGIKPRSPALQADSLPAEPHNDRLYFFGLQNHCRWWLQSLNQKMLAPWKKSYDQPRQHIKKQRHYFANKGPSSQSYGFL